MTFRRHVAALLLAPLLLTGCAALASAFGIAAPLVGPAIDAYTATARALASPTTSPIDVQALADALASRDVCTVDASRALMPTTVPNRSQAIAKVRDAIEADQKLLAALIVADADPSDGGAK